MDSSHWFVCFKEHYLEILGTLTGLVYIFYSIKQKRILWIFGGLSSVCYIFVFYQSGLFAYMLLYFYYVVISFYGWFAWGAVNEPDSGKRLVVTRMNLRLWLLTVLIVLLFWGIIAYLLNFFKNAEIPVADAFLTSGSIVATWLLMRKVIDHWILWIIIDLVTAVISIFKDLPFTAFLFFIYTLLAFKGYLEWKKELKPIHP